MNQHPLYALLQSGSPPLNADILMLTESGEWGCGQCREYNFHDQHEIHFESGDEYRHLFIVGKDRWMLLPSSSEEA